MQLPDFTAIDFETANPAADSACQLGLVVVRSGEIVDRQAWLIRPPTDRFDFTYIHGITWRNVAREADFGELWPEIRPFLENCVIAAHNVNFDMSVFFALIKRYRIEYWRGGAIDSVTVARRTWPSLVNHQLQTVAAHLCIPLDHHDAASDANACAEIIRHAEREQAGVVGKAMRWYGGR
jgi:DNA polymerase-3 subunit epsilon